MEEPVEAPSAGSVRPATVAIVGRPNVGKSALFNRLLGKRIAIVEDSPGVTRDRLYSLAEWRGKHFTLVDTGGIDAVSPHDAIATGTRRQAETAARDADAILFMVDAAEGLHPLDLDVAAILRTTRHPVIVVANKAESPSAAAAVHGEFAKLGFRERFSVSAIHGEGTGDLLDALIALLPAESAESSGDELAVAIVGQPNVGKSSLVNALLGEERTIVSDVPGTTRDAIDTILQTGERRLRLIDTAGVRKKARTGGAIEYYSTLRALGAISRCDVAVLLIDAMQGILAQDRRLAGIILEEGKGLVIAANKWDLARAQGEYSQAELISVIYDQIPFARFAPVTFLSALSKRRLASLLPLVLRVCENLDRHVQTARLNAVVRDAVIAHPPPAKGGRALRIFYCSQPAVHPPLFVMHCNDPTLAVASYRRFMENVLRTHFEFAGVPLRLRFVERRQAEE